MLWQTAACVVCMSSTQMLIEEANSDQICCASESVLRLFCTQMYLDCQSLASSNFSVQPPEQCVAQLWILCLAASPAQSSMLTQQLSEVVWTRACNMQQQVCACVQRCMAEASQRSTWQIFRGPQVQMSRLQPSMRLCLGGSPKTHLSKP